MFLTPILKLSFSLQVDVTDAEVLDLVEMEIRDLLTEMGFDGDGTAVIKGSALSALEGKNPDIGMLHIHL